MLHSICQQIWKTQQRPQCWKRSVFIPIQKKCNSKECSNYHAIVLISLASKVMFNILQAKLQQYMNWRLPDVHTGLRNKRSNCQHPLDHRERESQKIFLYASLIMQNLSLCRPQQTVEILKEMGVPDHLTCLLKSLYVAQKAAVRLRHRTTERFKSGKAPWQRVYSHSGYLTSI